MEITDLKHHPASIPEIATYHHREWAHLNPGQSIENRIDMMQSYLGEAFVPSMFIAKDKGELLGTAGILACDMDSKAELFPWLASVYVKEEHRNQRIGSALVKYATAQAKLAGFQRLYLFTPDRTRFYENLGWSVYAQESYHDTFVTVMHIELNV